MNKRQIIRKKSTEGAKSLRKNKNELNFSVTKDAKRKFLKDDWYKYKKAKKQPALTPEKNRAKIEMGKTIARRDNRRGVENITFSDEKRFLRRNRWNAVLLAFGR